LKIWGYPFRESGPIKCVPFWPCWVSLLELLLLLLLYLRSREQVNRLKKIWSVQEIIQWRSAFIPVTAVMIPCLEWRTAVNLLFLRKNRRKKLWIWSTLRTLHFSIQALTAVYIIRILLCREVRYTELMKITWIPADIWYDPEEDLFRRITTIWTR
jgi:ABC-type antimicrobial peptide transport system, permease component